MKNFGIINKAFCVLYFPIYLLFWVLHKVARALLALAYFGMLEKNMGKDIIRNLLKWHSKH